MKIFPYILARIGGLPFDQMGNLSWSDQQELEEYFKAIKEMADQKNQILSSLLEVVKTIEDYPAKFYLKILRRDIFNDRTIKIKSFEYKGNIEKEFYEVIEKVKTYKANLAKWEKQKGAFETLYKKQVVRSRNILQQNELPETLTKGLQLASHSLLLRLKDYQRKGAEQVNKKLLQTERKLLQYLCRISTKTSPFSTFTRLGIISLQEKLAYIPQHKVRLNNALFPLFRDTLAHYPPFYNQLKIRLNPARMESIAPGIDAQAEWKFLLNTRNIESVQQLEKNDLIDFIVEKLSDTKADFSFSGFMVMLAKNVEANPEDLVQYVLQLISYGFIEWDWPFSGLDPQWPAKLEKMLGDSSGDALLAELSDSLKAVKTRMLEFENGDIKTRNEVQQKAFDLIKNIVEKLLETTSLKDLEQVATTDHLKNILSVKFDLNKEQIFYEDVCQVADSRFSKNDFEAITKEVEQLTNLLNPFYYNPSKEKYLVFFKTNYPQGNVDLFTFYEEYFSHPSVAPPKIPDSEIHKRKAFLAHLKEKGTWKSLDHFHLDFSDFPLLKQNTKDHQISKATFLQLFKTDGIIKAYTDTAFMGYGKMFGRFLHLFPEELTKAIRDNNAIINDSTLWVENVDASVYNPNVHPALLSLEIQMPGSQNKLPKKNQIPVIDLEVRLDKSGDSLFLFDKKQQKQVVIFDYGFEALDNRSPMYQLLATFNYELVGPDILTDILDNRLAQKDKKGIIHQPRISVGNHLIIRRRGWGVPKAILPEKLNAESKAAYFLRLNHWRNGLLIPEKVFITIAAADFETDKNPRSTSDDYKPQYIDFTSPLLVQLFSKLISRVKEYLKIEEMLPEPGEDYEGEGERYVCEYLVEWKRTKT